MVRIVNEDTNCSRPWCSWHRCGLLCRVAGEAGGAADGRHRQDTPGVARAAARRLATHATVGDAPPDQRGGARRRSLHSRGPVRRVAAAAPPPSWPFPPGPRAVCRQVAIGAWLMVLGGVVVLRAVRGSAEDYGQARRRPGRGGKPDRLSSRQAGGCACVRLTSRADVHGRTKPWISSWISMRRRWGLRARRSEARAPRPAAAFRAQPRPPARSLVQLSAWVGV